MPRGQTNLVAGFGPQLRHRGPDHSSSNDSNSHYHLARRRSSEAASTWSQATVLGRNLDCAENIPARVNRLGAVTEAEHANGATTVSAPDFGNREASFHALKEHRIRQKKERLLARPRSARLCASTICGTGRPRFC
jgi:hypothetical protein